MKFFNFLIKILIIIILLLLADIDNLDYSQDIGAYEGNLTGIELYDDEYEFSDQKVFYYKYVVIPLMGIFSENSSILIFLRLINVLLFIVAIRFWKSSNIILLFSLIILLLSNNLSMNHMEYLRQGLALGVFLCAFNLKSLKYQLPLFVLSLALHYGVAFYLIVYTISVILRINLLDRFKENNYIIFLIFLPFVIMSFGLILNITDFIDFSNIGFLDSNRFNIFAYIFLFGYYYFIVFSNYAQYNKNYNMLIYLILIFILIYPVIRDFGRLLSIVLLFHWFIMQKDQIKTKNIINLSFIFIISLIF